MTKKIKTTDGMPKSTKKAKVTKAKNEVPDFTFDDMNKDLDKISLYGSKMSENTFSEVDHYISFGSYVINAAATGSIFGGIPNNRTVALAGPSGCLEKNEKILIYKMMTKSSDRKIIETK
jgi:hypothetical protein